MAAEANANVDFNAGTSGAAVSLAVGGPGAAAQPEPQASSKPRAPAHSPWAPLIAPIYEMFPLIRPMYGGPMRIIAFITFSAAIQKILDRLGVDPEAPRLTPARAPPLRDACDGQETGGADAMQDWDLANEARPDYRDYQRATRGICNRSRRPRPGRAVPIGSAARSSGYYGESS